MVVTQWLYQGWNGWIIHESIKGPSNHWCGTNADTIDIQFCGHGSSTIVIIGGSMGDVIIAKMTNGVDDTSRWP